MSGASELQYRNIGFIGKVNEQMRVSEGTLPLDK